MSDPAPAPAPDTIYVCTLDKADPGQACDACGYARGPGHGVKRPINERVVGIAPPLDPGVPRS